MIQPAGSWGYGVTRTWRRTISLGRALRACSRSSLRRKASAAESIERIQPGTQLAPSSITPHMRLGKRSSTPSKSRVDSVCMGAYGIAM
jgi:hypothetical protein